jgi:hypothetical protein
MRARSAPLGIVALLLAVAPALHAQMPAPAHFESWRPAPVPTSMPVGIPDSVRAPANGSGMVMGGITGMFAGYLVGALIGSAAYTDGDGYDQLGAAILGGLVAATFTTPIGVHLGNRGRGSLGSDVLLSAAIGAAGIAAASSTDSGAWLLLLPIGQIIGSAWMEAQSMPKVAQADASQ